MEPFEALDWIHGTNSVCTYSLYHKIQPAVGKYATHGWYGYKELYWDVYIYNLLLVDDLCQTRSPLESLCVPPKTAQGKLAHSPTNPCRKYFHIEVSTRWWFQILFIMFTYILQKTGWNHELV